MVAQFKSAPMVDALGFEVGEILAGELDEVTERLGEEYTSTFIGPGPHVSPYASTYHEDEGQLWGDSTVRVKRFIEATGLSFEANWASIPDHIAIELELMQRLSEYEAELWARCAAAPTLSDDNVDEQLRQCLEVQERFLLDHLCVWVSTFCEHLLARSTSPFYQEMANLTKSIVLSDVERLSDWREHEKPCT